MNEIEQRILDRLSKGPADLIDLGGTLYATATPRNSIYVVARDTINRLVSEGRAERVRCGENGVAFRLPAKCKMEEGP